MSYDCEKQWKILKREKINKNYENNEKPIKITLIQVFYMNIKYLNVLSKVGT